MGILTKKKSQFTELLEEAVAVTVEMEALDRNHRLSASAFLREAIKLANTTRERLDALQKIIDERPGFEQTKGFLMSLSRTLEHCSRPFPDTKRMGHAGLESATAELGTGGYTAMEAQCLAVQRLIDWYPETFGIVDDPEGHAKKVKALRDRHARLYERLKTEYGPEDLLIGQPDRESKALITFKVTGTSVTLAPLDNAAERLVRWAIANISTEEN